MAFLKICASGPLYTMCDYTPIMVAIIVIKHDFSKNTKNMKLNLIIFYFIKNSNDKI